MIDILLGFGFYLFPAVMILAALSDIDGLKIPNGLSAVLVVGFPLLAVPAGLDASQIGLHVAVAAAALGVGFLLFAFSIMGAGDGKLLAAAFLWFGPSGSLEFVFLMSVASLILCVGVLVYRAQPLPLPVGWAVRLHASKAPIPFGVAISCGALGAIPHTPWLMALVA